MRKILLSSLVIGALGLPGCSNDQKSNVDVTDVPHTSIKRQSIGNCWAYAVTGWIESMVMATFGQEINISESHISYWAAFYELQRNHAVTELNSGGSWALAQAILMNHGFLLEGEFIAEEAVEPMSARQKAFEGYINEQLQPGGRLYGSESRTKENIVSVLNDAFGVNILNYRPHSASNLRVGQVNGQAISLADALATWNLVDFPQEYGQPEVSSETVAQRDALLRRVMRALNDKQPVVISFMVDFNGLDPADGMFKYGTLLEAGPGDQGGHMVVLEDYVVDNVPGIGTIGEGDMSPELKEAALAGQLRYLVAKNSWGTDRSERGLTDGYTRLDFDYLTRNLDWEQSSGSQRFSSLMDVVLPPGY